MEVTYTIQPNKDEYLLHDNEQFWRFIQNDTLCWKIKRGGHWIDANIELLEKIYIKMKREHKLKRIV